jgi:nucleoside-diphosphate-sugar epimerase
MRVLVTGGAGYVGSVLVPALLERGQRVRVLDTLRFGGEGLLGVCNHPRFEFIRGDVRDAARTASALAGADIVIHLAALVGEPACALDEAETEDVKVHATQELLKLAKKAGARRFLFASTCSNYGVSAGGLADERSTLQPLSVYARSKIAAEQLVQEASDELFETVVLRLATVYGLSPRMRFDLLLNEFARDAVLKGWLLIYGADSWRPLVSVQDVARFVAVWLGIASGVVNVGGHNRTKRALAEALCTFLPRLEVEYKESRVDPRNYQASFEKASALGFWPQAAPEAGLGQMVRALQDGFFDDPYGRRHRNA